MKNLEISFDVGHSSIGWSVFKKTENMVFPLILGAGSLVFDDEICQAKDRGVKRHIRRNIIARRNRIKLLRSVFLCLDVLTPAELDNSQTEFPWLLASKVLAGKRTLTWEELWAVIRFYAHNRGYDGNSAWSKNQEEDGDSQKEQAANALMEKYNTSSMVETMCAFLEVDIDSKERPNPKKYFKGENVAFSRSIVVREVERIIDAHIGVLPKCDENFKKLIIGKWREVPCGISLPKRYTDDRGLLFGQYIPRFDNRIIKNCPISGDKVPACHSRDFLEYRWKMLMANLSGINSVKREDFLRRIDELAHIYGRFTKTTFKQMFEENFGELPSNFDAMFLTEEMGDALLIDPVKDIILKTINPNISRCLPQETLLSKLWKIIPKFVFTQMFRFKEFSIIDIASKLDSEKSEELKNLVKEIWEFATAKKSNVKSKNKQEDGSISFDDTLNRKMRITKLSGRSPYSRKVMSKACEEVMQSKDPRAVGGALYKSEDLTKAELSTNIDTWTNNHLVRHRLKMLKRLFMDLINRYGDGKLSNVKSVTIEVIKDITEFSGMGVKEKASVLSDLIKHHKSVSEYLSKEYNELDQNASIIRKARIADDLNWTCPYTGKAYSPRELFAEGVMEKEHIIPYSLRPSNSLESLVMTWKVVNDMKGERTALEFIKECQGQQVPGNDKLTIISLSKYEAFVKKLKKPLHKFSGSDLERIKRRNKLLLTEHYNKREASFLPSDLTQTSYVNKLAFKAIKSLYVNEEKMPEFIHLPGSITSAVRKNWNLLDCMREVCPEIFDEIKNENGTVDKRLKNKDEIRSITYLHHAIDAIVIGLTSSLFPHTTRFYELILKRNLNKDEREELRKIGLFRFLEKKWKLIDLSSEYLREITNAINECRVVKYLPKNMSGLKVEETMWRVVSENENGTVNLRQYTTSKDKNRRRQLKYDKLNKILLLGYDPNNLRKTKLSRNKAVFVVNRNFGVALSNPPVIIPYINVWKQLQELAKNNDGKFPDVLRRNHLIEVKNGNHKGIWRVASIKNDTRDGIILNLINSAYIKTVAKKNYAKLGILLKTLLKDGFKILEHDLTGL